MRRRQICLPTAWGWLVVLLVTGTSALLAARAVYPFLATTEPVGARVLIVEGWLPPEELDQAIAAFRSGGYERIVTTGGPIRNGFERWGAADFAQRARSYLVRNGISDDTVIAVTAPASERNRSFTSAVTVRDWAQRTGESMPAIDVVSSGVHSRRTRALYRMAFGASVRVGIFAATPSRPHPEAWWRTSEGVKEVPSEAISWLWTTLFFHPDAGGS